jgi:hypothetical protein
MSAVGGPILWQFQGPHAMSVVGTTRDGSCGYPI